MSDIVTLCPLCRRKVDDPALKASIQFREKMLNPLREEYKRLKKNKETLTQEKYLDELIKFGLIFINIPRLGE